jgi:hypothetical protein
MELQIPIPLWAVALCLIAQGLELLLPPVQHGFIGQDVKG